MSSQPDAPSQSRASVCVVTGSASGIGLAITRQMLHAGWTLIGIDIDNDSLQSRARELDSDRFHGLQGDVADIGLHGQVARRAGELGTLRCWVNNAGFRTSGSVHDIPAEEYDRCVAVYLSGTFWGASAAVRSMIEHGVDGNIMNISSRHADATSTFRTSRTLMQCRVVAVVMHLD